MSTKGTHYTRVTPCLTFVVHGDDVDTRLAAGKDIVDVASPVCKKVTSTWHVSKCRKHKHPPFPHTRASYMYIQQGKEEFFYIIHFTSEPSSCRDKVHSIL